MGEYAAVGVRLSLLAPCGPDGATAVVKFSLQDACASARRRITEWTAWACRPLSEVRLVGDVVEWLHVAIASSGQDDTLWLKGVLALRLLVGVLRSCCAWAWVRKLQQIRVWFFLQLLDHLSDI